MIHTTCDEKLRSYNHFEVSSSVKLSLILHTVSLDDTVVMAVFVLRAQVGGVWH